MLEFEQTITHEDLYAFNLYVLDSSEVGKKIYRKQLFFCLFVIAIGAIVTFLLTDWMFTLIYLLITGVGFPLLFRPLVKFSIKRNLVNAKKYGTLKEDEWQKLSVTPEGLRDETQEGESLIRWETVVSIAEDDDRYYIFTGPVRAYIIKKEIDPTKASDFIAEVKKLVGKPV